MEEEEKRDSERESERTDRRRRIVARDVHTVSGHDAIVVVPSAPLSYARSERDYLARRERANIGSYSSRLYGAYVPTGFLRAFPPTLPAPLPPPHSSPRRRALPPSLTRISTPLLSAPCIFGSAKNSTFLSVRVNSRARRRDLSPGRFDRS